MSTVECARNKFVSPEEDGVIVDVRREKLFGKEVVKSYKFVKRDFPFVTTVSKVSSVDLVASIISLIRG